MHEDLSAPFRFAPKKDGWLAEAIIGLDGGAYRKCTKCKHSLPVASFLSKTRRIVKMCSKCRERSAKDYVRAGGALLQQPARLRRYGLTEEQYNRLWDAQEGKCAICGGLPNEVQQRTLHIDHDHRTGHVRGLLCVRCNHAIGLIEATGLGLRAWVDNTERYLSGL